MMFFANPRVRVSITQLSRLNRQESSIDELLPVQEDIISAIANLKIYLTGSLKTYYNAGKLASVCGLASTSR